MKVLPAFAAMLLACAAQAAPPQPVIQMPRHPAPIADSSAPADSTWKTGGGACMGDGTGYLRARIGGAMKLDLDWKDAQLRCGGDARADGSGLRLSFAGPGPGGKVLHLVFGVSSAREGAAGKELPTNLTVMLEGGGIFATQGDDKCTTDQLTQRRLPSSTGARVWRIEGRGFCVAPANALSRQGRILISRFDFAGRIEFSGRS